MKNKINLLLTSCLFVFGVQQISAKEIYTCTTNGKTVYQGKPCAGSKELTDKVQKAQNQEKSRQAALERESAERAARKEPKIGMIKTEAEKSTWGYPDKINTTTTASGVNEQWVYKWGKYQSRYLYFKNNILTTIQN
ncbi:hypothetical protein [Acinetobacter sp. ANC 4648]|uniref:hypothetical protein n=1 Tax=Acinetobacter sp. ANC 4648 TaxID=1977875 RepID=UPI000B57CDDF|nr:hypothetical protein [Acinetobacter sp. ANC 4648]OTG79417.1 hypothetical protein B9T27_14550 [Acinetobacter sp. ANC 4648]